MDDKQVFAQNLKDLREKMEISQREVARRLQIQPTAVSAYERGEGTGGQRQQGGLYG